MLVGRVYVIIKGKFNFYINWFLFVLYRVILFGVVGIYIVFWYLSGIMVIYWCLLVCLIIVVFIVVWIVVCVIFWVFVGLIIKLGCVGRVIGEGFYVVVSGVRDVK